MIGLGEASPSSEVRLCLSASARAFSINRQAPRATLASVRGRTTSRGSDAGVSRKRAPTDYANPAAAATGRFPKSLSRTLRCIGTN
jgi:hypothetical protein